MSGPKCELPAELWQQCFQLCDLQSLLNVSVTCRWLSQIAKVKIYRSIVIGQKKGKQPPDYQLYKLLRSLVFNPELRPFIKELSVQGAGQIELREFLPTDIIELEISRSGVEVDKPWGRQFSSGDPISLLIALLVFCQKIETLKLNQVVSPDNLNLRPVFKAADTISAVAAGTTARPLTFLRHFEYSDRTIDPERPIIEVTSVTAIFHRVRQLQNIESASIKLETYSLTLDHSFPAGNESTLTSLRLESPDLLPVQLPNILALTPHLTTLHLGFIRHYNIKNEFVGISADRRVFHLPALSDALSLVAGTLTSLSITIKSQPRLDDPHSLSRRMTFPLPSLHHLTSLRRLLIPAEVLLPGTRRAFYPVHDITPAHFAVLPPSLEALALSAGQLIFDSAELRFWSAQTRRLAGSVGPDGRAVAGSAYMRATSNQVLVDAITGWIAAGQAAELREVRLVHLGRGMPGGATVLYEMNGQNVQEELEAWGEEVEIHAVRIRKAAKRCGVRFEGLYLKRWEGGKEVRLATFYDPEQPQKGIYETIVGDEELEALGF